MVATQIHHAPQVMAKPRSRLVHDTSSWMRLLITTALFSLATGAILMGLDSGPAMPNTPAAPPSQLGLRVTAQKQQVEIRWDHVAVAALNPVKGLLKISESDNIKSIPLDRSDLQDGFVSYLAPTSEVRVSFEVTEASGITVSESARVVAIR
jgi:hypothetical protein